MRTRPRIPAGICVLALAIGCHIALSIARPRAVAQDARTPPLAGLTLPNRADSLKFAVLGDFGTGRTPQYELAAQMARLHDRFRFELVITVGDNIYGSERADDFRKKFEEPYKPLLDANVKFYASLGNHDDREQRYYKLFNMDGKLYYSFKAPRQDTRFFALESTYRDPKQIQWLEKELQDSGEKWKIPYFHHPLYSSGDRHGSDAEWRRILEPLFVKYGVSVVFAGHDHFYERVKPQKGIVHFVVGSGGQLRRGNIDKTTGMTAKGFDTEQAFLAAEISGDEMFFNVVSRAGQIVDTGVIQRRKQEELPSFRLDPPAVARFAPSLFRRPPGFPWQSAKP
jgi:predicted MPP superfamily phosphohydrolase